MISTFTRLPLNRASSVAAILAALIPWSAHGQDFVVPDGVRVIDVTDLPADLLAANPGVQNAVPNDGADDWPAIQAALDWSPAAYRTVYLPDGDYLLSDGLQWQNERTDPGLRAAQGGGGQFTSLRGQSRKGTRLRLEDSAELTNIARLDVPAVISMGQLDSRNTGSTRSFANEVRDLTVLTGDNPGVTGVFSNTNNGGGVDNVAVFDETNGQGLVGISASYTGNIGPQLIADVEVVGFGTGIGIASNEFGATLRDVVLRDQAETGLRNRFNTISITGLQSFQSAGVPAITVSGPDGVTSITDAVLRGSNAHDVPAVLIDEESDVLLRDIRTEDYAFALGTTGATADPLQTDFIAEYRSNKPLTLFADTPARSLGLDVPNIPDILLETDAARWANVEDARFAGGAVPGDGMDDTAAFQAAIDSGATHVAVPNARLLDQGPDGFGRVDRKYTINDTLYIRGDVSRMQGFRAQIEGSGRIVVTDGSAPAVMMEGLQFTSVFDNLRSAARMVVDTSRDVVISSSSLPASGLDIEPGSRVFLEDVLGGPIINRQAEVYAWQLDNESDASIYAERSDVENRDFDTPKILNDGGILYISGMKTEQRATAIKTINGGKTELLGGLFLTSQRDVTDLGPDGQVFPGIIVEDSDMSASYRETSNGSFTPYRVGIRETQDGETREFTAFSFNGSIGEYVNVFGTGATLYSARAAEGPDAIAGVVSDTFEGDALDTSVWHVADFARGTSAAVVEDDAGSRLAIVVPGALEGSPVLNLYGNNERATRVLQRAEDTDFTIQTKFLSEPSQRGAFQGLTVIDGTLEDLSDDGRPVVLNDTTRAQSKLDQIHFHVVRAGNSQLRLSVTVKQPENGNAWSQPQVIDIAEGAARYLRIRRSGDVFSFEYSADGETFDAMPQTYTRAMQVRDVGLTAGTFLPISDLDGWTVEVAEFLNSDIPLQRCEPFTGAASKGRFIGTAAAECFTGTQTIGTVAYGDSEEGIAVSLADGTAEGGHAEGDSYVGIRDIFATIYDDVLVGDENPNWLFGQAGQDTLIGGAGDDYLNGSSGNDLLIGGPGADDLTGHNGSDTVSYADSPAGVNVDLASVGSGGDAEGDIFKGVESVTGSRFDDVLRGRGFFGRLTGGAGADTFVYGPGMTRVEITDFDPNIDRIRIEEPVASFEDLRDRMEQVGANVRIRYEGSRWLWIVNASVHDLHSGNVEF